MEALEACAEFSQRGVGYIGTGWERRRSQLRANELQPLALIRQRNLNGSHPWTLHDALIQLDLVLRDQTDCDIRSQEFRILRPAFQNDQRVPVLGGHAGNIAGGCNGLGKVDDQGDLFAIRDAEPEVVIQDVQNAVGITRQALRIVGLMKAVVPGKRIAKIRLHVRTGEAQAATAVISQH